MEEPTPTEVMEEVRRIVSSGGFAGSDPARHMLLFLAEHDRNHPGESVKELTLATEALGKGIDYDPRTDSSVRVVASRLRSKLAEYYIREGSHDPVLITIPKGSYSILKAYRAVEPPPAKLADAPPPPRRRRQILLFCLAGVIGACAGFLPGYIAGTRSVRPAIAGVSKTFWRHFVSGDPPIIVYSNPRFVGNARTGMHLFNPASPLERPMNALFTGVGEVSAVHDITRQLNALGKEARVKRANLFTWDDARSNDLIFIGGQIQNLPMSQLPPLEKFNFKPDNEEPFASTGAVRNERPAPGEQHYYFPSGDFDNGLDYGIMALIPGVTASRRVLVLAGIHTFATEGAASFVVNPALLGELSAKLGVGNGNEMPMFEALIEVPVRGGSPLPPKLLITYRRSPVKN